MYAHTQQGRDPTPLPVSPIPQPVASTSIPVPEGIDVQQVSDILLQAYIQAPSAVPVSSVAPSPPPLVQIAVQQRALEASRRATMINRARKQSAIAPARRRCEVERALQDAPDAALSSAAQAGELRRILEENRAIEADFAAAHRGLVHCGCVDEAIELYEVWNQGDTSAQGLLGFIPVSPAVGIPPQAPPAAAPAGGIQALLRHVILAPRDLHGPSWTSQDHHHQCGENCGCCRSRAGDPFGTCPVCESLRGDWWSRPNIADLMASHVMAEFYDGDVPRGLELVMVFEEDDVVYTWPDVPSVPAEEDPDEEPQEWTVESVMALSNSVTVPPSEPSPQPYQGPAHQLDPPPALGTSTVSNQAWVASHPSTHLRAPSPNGTSSFSSRP